ncbi:class I SAM-dependent methyltransferase [Phormidium sp. CLA17]|uniref:class I SAM-dependent methyltransferase n=1 Tax=Leptolyngbya sp. Cla-17 TaxID=2803751 RepID=UPI001490951D|nr:class I SAM-dependent methyltransferase [Leptolyngbya sp. Cla-17]MBM0740368.1 class I SAM-dependent methyltransferase [Leptolyngbya sp. Cla-17]
MTQLIDDPNDAPLYAMQPLQRFSDRATDYANHRPSYPAAAIAAILAGLSEPHRLVAADIGAGTGISSRLLADKGLQVWAVEPNAAMREAATFHPNVTFQAVAAEQTQLPNASVDLVTCFQAFHWFDPACLPEFHRILKPSGRLALVWNSRDRQDPFTQAYTQLVQQLSNHHPAESRMVSAQPLFSSPYFDAISQQEFLYQQSLDLAGLIGRAQSVSYMPKDEDTTQRLVQGLKDLCDRWADAQGRVCLVYTTQVFLATSGRVPG